MSAHARPEQGADLLTSRSQLTEIVDRHDDLVRELFHLDRFVTLVGYDPADAKGASRPTPR